jgi:hypothetical protein
MPIQTAKLARAWAHWVPLIARRVSGSSDCEASIQRARPASPLILPTTASQTVGSSS